MTSGEKSTGCGDFVEIIGMVASESKLEYFLDKDLHYCRDKHSFSLALSVKPSAKWIRVYQWVTRSGQNCGEVYINKWNHILLERNKKRIYIYSELIWLEKCIRDVFYVVDFVNKNIEMELGLYKRDAVIERDSSCPENIKKYINGIDII